MKLVIDTSILIDYLRGGTLWEELVRNLKKDTEIYLPTIVVFEIFSGKSTSNPKITKEVNNFLTYFQPIELTEDIAKRAGELFRDVNRNLGAPDYIIAASALELNATVVTLNKKHFEQISNLNIYPLE
jgi:predicted nucleic acid-binding protein